MKLNVLHSAFLPNWYSEGFYTASHSPNRPNSLGATWFHYLAQGHFENRITDAMISGCSTSGATAAPKVPKRTKMWTSRLKLSVLEVEVEIRPSPQLQFVCSLLAHEVHPCTFLSLWSFSCFASALSFAQCFTHNTETPAGPVWTDFSFGPSHRPAGQQPSSVASIHQRSPKSAKVLEAQSKVRMIRSLFWLLLSSGSVGQLKFKWFPLYQGILPDDVLVSVSWSSGDEAEQWSWRLK